MIALLQHDFVQNAFLGGTIVALVSAIIGYFVVIRSQAFAGHALSHISFAGATGAVLLGLNSLVGMFLLTLLAAAGMGALGERLHGRDIEIGMVLSFALGLGVLFLSLYTRYATQTVGVLFGSIFSVSQSSVLITLGCGIATLIILALMFRPLLFASIDPEVARARGIPVRLLSIIFLLLLAITVSEAVQVVGVLLVFALLVAPAACAQRWASQPLTALLLSLAFSLFFTWGGLLLALVGSGPVSFYISALAAISYFVSLRLPRLRSPRRYSARPRSGCEEEGHAGVHTASLHAR